MTTPLSARLSGQPLTRVDGRLKVTGAALYAADNPVPDHLHAVLVCSTVSRATVASMDTDAASDHPDVVRVITDFPGIELPYDISRVNFFGQPLAVVVGNTLEAATHGAALVSVRYNEEAQSTNLDDASGENREPSRMEPAYSRGDADTALRTAPVVVDREYSIARNYHNPMEIPATIASWDGDQLTVWDKVQGIHYSRAAYSGALGIPAENIRVVSPFVGGAFGSAGETWPHQFLAAEVARQLRRPVKLSLTRPQMYAAIGYRPTSRQRLALGTDRDGRFLATVHESEVEVSRYGGYEDSPTEGTRLMYTSPAFRSAASVVPLDTSEATYMRGPGAVTGAFALECAIDEVAEQLRLDPIEVRLRNEPTEDQTNGTPFSTRRLTECFRRGANAFGWSRRNATPGAVRDGDQLIGMGTASALYHTLRSPSSAMARVNSDGRAEIFAAASDIGPGTYTAMTQLAADALGLPLDRVTFSLGDSDYPQAATQYGSQGMASVGSSIEITANILRDRIIRTAVLDPASPLNGARPDEIDVVDGQMQVRGDSGRAETYRDMLRRRGEPSIEASETYTPEDVSAQFSMHAYGAVFAEVAVDELLGTVRVRRIYAVYDAGRIINPRMAHSQALGGMTQGIGMALLESAEVDYRDGRLVNANLSDYLVPVNADVPVLDAVYLDARDDIADPIGVKGLGEVVMVGVPAAIANAVYNATGRRVTDLPISVESLL
ncbi:acylaldehyde oxidase [Rhodococcus sp. 05-2254-5]|uniref:xanthine dehydrogenase family protein molybdopterin-binding subunit n=1 Tax=unclassified Rhodococcus (in: high G+C Gram-positive bacteria) TaxID=192944 RepID=UPI000B9A235C|nr:MULTISPECIES: xanthine dehydrogenase family protein molybdopterin-binding subunit [unclassified Rhodococcus (in: high G+C Gram-positive bacteria)]OZE32103.1 acylaldehyde oxidase [Rhodococcus sp. 05-2254-5]OZE59526.1 acylaldehyde oxidase [Rhodococcus sp. 05-2254-1]